MRNYVRTMIMSVSMYMCMYMGAFPLQLMQIAIWYIRDLPKMEIVKGVYAQAPTKAIKNAPPTTLAHASIRGRPRSIS